MAGNPLHRGKVNFHILTLSVPSIIIRFLQSIKFIMYPFFPQPELNSDTAEIKKAGDRKLLRLFQTGSLITYFLTGITFLLQQEGIV